MPKSVKNPKYAKELKGLKSEGTKTAANVSGIDGSLMVTPKFGNDPSFKSLFPFNFHKDVGMVCLQIYSTPKEKLDFNAFMFPQETLCSLPKHFHSPDKFCVKMLQILIKSF